MLLIKVVLVNDGVNVFFVFLLFFFELRKWSMGDFKE